MKLIVTLLFTATVALAAHQADYASSMLDADVSDESLYSEATEADSEPESTIKRWSWDNPAGAVDFSTPASIELGYVIRDVTQVGRWHPDFQGPCCFLWQGMVKRQLSAEGKPERNPAGPGGIRSEKSFDAWFNAHDYDNTPHPDWDATITEYRREVVLRRQGYSWYGHSWYWMGSDAWFPIDNVPNAQLWGGHNYLFTAEGNFVFTPKPLQFFCFSGDDDVWVFFNGHLVIDLGGVHGRATQCTFTNYFTHFCPYDQECKMSHFFAERHTVGSNFHFWTSMSLEDEPHPPVVQSFSLYQEGSAPGEGCALWPPNGNAHTVHADLKVYTECRCSANQMENCDVESKCSSDPSKWFIRYKNATVGLGCTIDQDVNGASQHLNVEEDADPAGCSGKSNGASQSQHVCKNHCVREGDSWQMKALRSGNDKDGRDYNVKIEVCLVAHPDVCTPVEAGCKVPKSMSGNEREDKKRLLSDEHLPHHHKKHSHHEKKHAAKKHSHKHH